MYIKGNNIISSLGFTTEENFNAVNQSFSGIKHYDAGMFNLPESFMASLINKERLRDEFLEISSKNNYSDLESAAILSVFYANKEAKIDLSNEKTIFILSTTKGNVDFLNTVAAKKILPKQVYLWHTAELITHFFNNPNTPIVVSNACISGAAAQIVAMRALQSEKYNHAVVVGVDLLSKFIISGFQAFKALSPEHCKPFDKDRCGLNLGEAAATMIFSKMGKYPPNEMRFEIGCSLVDGAVRNDATHISAPSRTGEGSFRALKAVLQDIDIEDVAFINAHGTATPYNDAMEANAIIRTGLEKIPVNALKSYFGHTLGAAGVVETIISAKALCEGTILKTLGFEKTEPIIMNEEQYALKVADKNMKTDKGCFVKMMSGFGGVNVALLYKIICH